MITETVVLRPVLLPIIAKTASILSLDAVVPNVLNTVSSRPWVPIFRVRIGRPLDVVDVRLTA